MSNFPAYTTKTFSPSQKFFVLDPNTGSPAFVQGSDLVAQLTPNSNYVYSESTRTSAVATDYEIGSLVETAGATSAGDNFAAVYLVVEGGEGDFPMQNGNDLLVIRGDELLRGQLASFDASEGSDLVAHTGTTDTVTEALDKRTIYVGSVAELEALSLPVGVSVYLTEDGRNGEGLVKAGTPPSDPLKGRYITLSNGNYWERTIFNEALTSWWGASPETDITGAVKAAQNALVSKGGGKLTINVNGWATIADLTVDATYVDYAIDVLSGIEITAIPEFELRADKTKGSDAGGYCTFRIFEGVENVKIHGFHNIDGIDRNTVKGIGQVVAIRGDDTLNPARNIDVWDMEYREIRDEPFRLGQTSVNGQIGENVNIWDIRGDGSISHGVVMRSILNGHASALRIKNAGRLGIDISSYCKNCHLDGSKGDNEFINTVGGAKIDGGANNVDCSIGDYYYDGDVAGAGDTNGFAYRLVGTRAKAHDIYAVNCGGSGFNCLIGTLSAQDMEMENILIENITNGDGSSSTFNGKPFVLSQEAAGDINLRMKNVKIRNALVEGRLAVDGVHGDLSLDSANVFIYSGGGFKNTIAKNISLDLSLKNAVVRAINDPTNGGADNVRVFLKQFEGASELKFSGCSNVRVSGDGKMAGTNTNQIFFEDCANFYCAGLAGEGVRMVSIIGTLGFALIEGLSGVFSDGLIYDVSTISGKALFANCVNNGAGGFVVSAGATQSNLI